MAAKQSTATKQTKAAAKVASASDFKKRSKGQLLPLPSGLTARVKRVNIQELILQADLPNPLMVIVSEALEKGQKMDPKSMVGVEGDNSKVDLSKVREMFELVNAVMLAAFVEPKLHPEPEDEADRDDDLVYIDEVDAEDKMFVFQWITGGTDDVARFRQEAESSMAALVEGESGQ